MLLLNVEMSEQRRRMILYNEAVLFGHVSGLDRRSRKGARGTVGIKLDRGRRPDDWAIASSVEVLTLV